MALKTIVHPKDQGLIEWLRGLVNTRKTEQQWWIGGGSALNWYNDRPCDSDVDIFFNSEDAYIKMRSKLDQQIDSRVDQWFVSVKGRWSVLNRMETENAVTYEIAPPDTPEGHFPMPNTYKVQLILRQFYDSPQAVLDDFDITVCQIVTDGYRMWTGERFARDVRNRLLRFHKLSPGSAKRLIKYWIYGYEPDAATLQMITDAEGLNWTAGEDDYA